MLRYEQSDSKQTVLATLRKSTQTKVMMTIINPSVRLLAVLNINSEDRQYRRTCNTRTCSCFSHESGYYFIEVEQLPEGVKVHEYPGSPHTHRWTVLREEYVEAHTAKGLPANAPQWAYTLDSRSCRNSVTYGENVEVVEQGEFTVVRLRQYSGLYPKVMKVFATKNGTADNTAEYKKWNYETLRDEKIADFVQEGLSEKEAVRLFEIGREQWTGEQTSRLIEFRDTFRKTQRGLVLMCRSFGRREQTVVATEWRMIQEFENLSCPRTQALAQKALWVFHGLKDSATIAELAAPMRPAPEEESGFSIPGHLFASLNA